MDLGDPRFLVFFVVGVVVVVGVDIGILLGFVLHRDLLVQLPADGVLPVLVHGGSGIGNFAILEGGGGMVRRVIVFGLLLQGSRYWEEERQEKQMADSHLGVRTGWASGHHVAMNRLIGNNGGNGVARGGGRSGVREAGGGLGEVRKCWKTRG